MEILIDYLLISFFVTYLIIYITYPKPKIVLKYPKINDKVSNLYIDNNDICYRYHRKEIKCNK